MNDQETQVITSNETLPETTGHQLMNADDLVARRDTIIRISKIVMREGTHYGVPYEGAPKPTLLKAGAEVLCNTFQIAPKLEVTKTPIGDNGHREYDVRCKLYHIHTGSFLGEGIGSCSTMESKYRYRTVDRATEIPVPKHLWDIKKNDGYPAFKEELTTVFEQEGGEREDWQELGVTKSNGRWLISLKGKGENPDIADTYNTVLKMGKKRALVDAILTATAASEFYTQDLEDYDTQDNGLGITYESGEKGVKDPTGGVSEQGSNTKEFYELVKSVPKVLKERLVLSTAGTEEREFLEDLAKLYHTSTERLKPHVDYLGKELCNDILTKLCQSEDREEMEDLGLEIEDLVKQAENV